MMTNRYILRNATPHDTARIKNFLDQESHEFVANRDDAQLLSSIKNRHMLIVQHAKTEKLVACAGQYLYGNGKYVEGGAPALADLCARQLK